MRTSLLLLLLLFTSGAIAQSWQCDGNISHGADNKSTEAVTLIFEGGQVSLTSPNYSYTTGKLDTKNNISVYAEQEASDLANERITTSRMLRFDHATGHLVFFDHTADSLLITASCHPEQSEGSP